MSFTEEIVTEREIGAPSGRVWHVLMDFDRYPEWNPFVLHAEGERRVGSRLEIHLAGAGGGKGMRFRPTVTDAEPRRRFAWLGRLGIPGLFDGAHRFELEELPGGRTRFVQAERFSGVLLPFVRRSLREKTAKQFDAMNRALEARVEAA